MMGNLISERAILLIISIALVACDEKDAMNSKGPAEKAGAQIDNAVSKAREEISKAGEKAGQAMQEAGKALEDKSKETQKAQK